MCTLFRRARAQLKLLMSMYRYKTNLKPKAFCANKHTHTHHQPHTHTHRAHTHPARTHTQWPHTQAFDPALPEGSERAIFDKELDFVSLEVASNLIGESNNGVCVSDLNPKP